MRIPLEFPPLTPGGPAPVWENNRFRIGDRRVSVLEYGWRACGWSDDLTAFHQDLAGPNHFIDRASRAYALGQLSRGLHSKTPVILEIGCSSGYMLQEIHDRLPNAALVGSDIIRGALEQLALRMPGIPLLQFDLADCPLPDNSFDAVVLLNVLEHMDDDEKALRQVRRILKPGGLAVIEVPGGPRLYDIYDKMLMHRRRYTLSNLQTLVHKTGFKVVRKSHLGFFMYPGFWLVKQRNKRLFSAGETAAEQVVRANIKSSGSSLFLGFLMKFELLLGKWISYPFGIRCLMTCLK